MKKSLTIIILFIRLVALGQSTINSNQNLEKYIGSLFQVQGTSSKESWENTLVL